MIKSCTKFYKVSEAYLPSALISNFNNVSSYSMLIQIWQILEIKVRRCTFHILQ